MKSFRAKIIVSTLLCVFLVGLFINLFLYQFLTRIVEERSDYINFLNLQTTATQISNGLNNFQNIGIQIMLNADIAEAMHVPDMIDPDNIRTVISSQEILQRLYSNNSNLVPHISQVVVFNEKGIHLNAFTRLTHTVPDIHRIMFSSAYSDFMESGELLQLSMGNSFVNDQVNIFLWGRITDPDTLVQKGILFIELDQAFITELLSPLETDISFVSNQADFVIPDEASVYAYHINQQDLNDNTFHFNDKNYIISSLPIDFTALTIYSLTDITNLSTDAYTILYTIGVVLLTSLLAAILLSFITGTVITRPLNKLKEHLRFMSHNGFVNTPEIAQGSGEIAEMGQVINEMTDSINQLLTETEEMYRTQKNQEIALLQSQVNPHFLYNTLDSIRWMAVIQKNAGIEKATRSLSHLLRNLAKGVDNKITLQEELILLKDYFDIQALRYIDLVEFENNVTESFWQYRIIKFTLQPLIENAIFHGIMPSGNCGTIKVTAQEDETFLNIIVEDDGIGMTNEQIQNLLTSKKSVQKHEITSIGISNVNHRLKLIYGDECGLFFESEVNQYTRAIVKIKKER